MNYDMTKPCDACPFLKKMSRGFPMRRLQEFAENGVFPCHKTCDESEDDDGGSVYVSNKKSQACSGALIFNEKRERPTQMMIIAERLGMYDRSKLDMSSPVR